MVIHIRKAKRHRARDTLLSPQLLSTLRRYFASYRPQGPYLFPGYRADAPLTRNAIGKSLHNAACSAGLRIHVYPHLLRQADCYVSRMKFGSDKNGTSNSNSRLDALTSSKIKSELRQEFSGYGYELIKESSNEVGWAGTVMLGKKGKEAQIYRVVLGEVTSTEEGRKMVDKLASEGGGSDSSSKVGTKKFVYVECMSSVTRSSPKPGPCYGTDRSSKMIEAMTDLR